MNGKAKANVVKVNVVNQVTLNPPLKIDPVYTWGSSDSRKAIEVPQEAIIKVFSAHQSSPKKKLRIQKSKLEIVNSGTSAFNEIFISTVGVKKLASKLMASK